MAISHITTDDAPAERVAQITALAEDYKGTQNMRNCTEFSSWFEDLEMVAPGIVHATDWRPEPLPADAAAEETEVRPLYWSGVGHILPPRSRH